MKSFNLIFCNRNDGYASNQDTRIKLFIEYYTVLQKRIPELHFSVIDWNPPPNKPLLSEAFDWNKLKNVKHTVVSAEEHERRFPNSKRKINDYTGRNIGIDTSSCDFHVILNQDIFLSPMVFEQIDRFPEYGSYFFRANRLDVPDDVLSNGENVFDAPVIKVHNRLFPFPLNLLAKETHVPFFEKHSRGHAIQRFAFTNGTFKLFASALKTVLNLFLSDQNKLSVLDFLFLHMNASGDFLVIPDKATRTHKDIRYPETDSFYMHTDGYILIRLQNAGLKQVVLRRDAEIRHIDHSRPDRSNDLPYSFHKEQYLEILNQTGATKNV